MCAQINVLTVSQLTQAIKTCLESTFRSVWLQGEVSNAKLQSSGHFYFSLKDSQAQISAVMFRMDAATLRQVPKDGDHVMVRGEINVYPPKGNYQIIVRELSYVGLGELLLKLEQLKIKLHQMGWFSAERKKALPKMPRRIGIVTSPTGAVIQDILKVLSRRFSGVHVILNPVKVQGEGAAQEIAQAIDQFNKYDLVDVMIVGRGGGSLEDLWAFNEEIVATAIYNSRIPIISAVGHETDHCIADYVADVRAPTPSAAAEIVIAEKAHQQQHLFQMEKRLTQTMIHLTKQGRHQLEGLIRQPVFYSPYALLGAWMQKIDDLRGDLENSILQLNQKRRMQIEGFYKRAQALKPTSQIQNLRQKFAYYQQNLQQKLYQSFTFFHQRLNASDNGIALAWKTKLDSYRALFSQPLKRRQLDQIWGRRLTSYHERIERLKTPLYAIDPKNLLKKGYSIIFSEKDGSVINSVHLLKKEDKLRLLVSDGEAKATVTETMSNE